MSGSGYLSRRSLTVKLGRRSLDARVPFKGVEVFDASCFDSAHFLHSSSPMVTVTLEVR
ncbi:MAG: hypothetical protein QW587_10030 [Candidatus Bathyarchaeia archaeon]